MVEERLQSLMLMSCRLTRLNIDQQIVTLFASNAGVNNFRTPPLSAKIEKNRHWKKCNIIGIRPSVQVNQHRKITDSVQRTTK